MPIKQKVHTLENLDYSYHMYDFVPQLPELNQCSNFASHEVMYLFVSRAVEFKQEASIDHSPILFVFCPKVGRQVGSQSSRA